MVSEELLITGLNLTFVIGVSMYVLMTVHHSTFLLLVVYHMVQFLGHYYFYYILMIFVMPSYWSSWFCLQTIQTFSWQIII